MLGQLSLRPDQAARGDDACLIAEAELEDEVHAVRSRTVPQTEFRQVTVAGAFGPQLLHPAPSLHHLVTIGGRANPTPGQLAGQILHEAFLHLGVKSPGRVDVDAKPRGTFNPGSPGRQGPGGIPAQQQMSVTPFAPAVGALALPGRRRVGGRPVDPAQALSQEAVKVLRGHADRLPCRGGGWEALCRMERLIHPLYCTAPRS